VSQAGFRRWLEQRSDLEKKKIPVRDRFAIWLGEKQKFRGRIISRALKRALDEMKEKSPRFAKVRNRRKVKARMARESRRRNR